MKIVLGLVALGLCDTTPETEEATTEPVAPESVDTPETENEVPQVDDREQPLEPYPILVGSTNQVRFF